MKKHLTAQQPKYFCAEAIEKFVSRELGSYAVSPKNNFVNRHKVLFIYLLSNIQIKKVLKNIY